MKLFRQLALVLLVIPLFGAVLSLPFFAHAAVKVLTVGTDFYPILNTDTLANGGFSVYGSAPYHGTGAAPSPQIQRICYIIDPTAYPTSWRSGGYKSPENNHVVKWDGTVWKRYGAKHNNNHVSGGSLECTTDAVADTSLKATKTQIVKGDSTTLSWNSQYGKVRQATCTATNFNASIFVAGHWETNSGRNTCPGGTQFDARMPNVAATWWCGQFTDPVWVPDYTGPAPYGGSTTVTPDVTTTYTYTCTNANGPSSASVTVTVLNEPDPSCSDGIDNNNNGSIDGNDPDCGTGGPGTEVPHANLPDLTADAVNEDLVPSGTPTTLSVLIANAGDAPTQVGFKNLFQIDNDSDHANVFATVTGTSPMLNQNGTDVSKATYTFPSAGTWYVRACADNDASWHGTVNESNENNNCSTGGWKQVTVAADVPTASLWASPPSVASNEASTLSWACTKSTSASISPDIGPVTPVDSGTISTGPLLSKTDYTLTCTGPKGSAKSFYSVLVNPPTVDIHADPPLVRRGGQTTVLWESHGATSCLITGPGITADLAHLKIGSLTTTINNQSTYAITCNGVATKSITVGVVPEFNEK